jgi:tetraacyldisaccharide 4'-kinase
MGLRAENLEQFAIDVILERRSGIRATILRGLLYILSFVYEGLVQFRLFLYRHRIFRERALGCLVISIGNLTVGGTGENSDRRKIRSGASSRWAPCCNS